MARRAMGVFSWPFESGRNATEARKGGARGRMRLPFEKRVGERQRRIGWDVRCLAPCFFSRLFPLVPLFPLFPVFLPKRNPPVGCCPCRARVSRPQSLLHLPLPAPRTQSNLSFPIAITITIIPASLTTFVKRHKYILSDGGTRHTYIRITQSNLSLASEPQGPRILALIHHHHCETRPHTHTQRHAIIPLLCAKIPHPLSSNSNTISLQPRHDNLSYTTAKSPHNDSRNQVPSGRHLLPGLLPCL
ncbi:hypothetical protein BKA56DRAFT_340777 [Ilyonectria sp. MPI-CAGE-AT-0026]|nr:hypothetical protein BKA56DRAFT_340777 [Ilyonectria sp. MPI-CAGE-AT-0026]